ncbi:CsbD family protein [Amaricoccus tamworthensis]|uniref:CsbD family protein n=1 Tax=Amaricoccus tamworthensis TaxID=57002 RepID=UPI003C7B6C1F
MAINSDTIEGNWKEWSGKAREKWGELTDDELQQAQGNREQLEGLIQQKYGKSKEEAKQEVDQFFGTL